jgi:MFS family permease
MGKNPRLFYGYIIVAAGFLISMATWGTLYSFGIFFKPVLEQFGWTRAATAGAYSLMVVVSGLGNIVVGKLTDKFGPRLVISVFGILMGAGYMLMSHMSTLWEFYLYYAVLLGLGGSVNVVPLASAVSRWFIKGRGIMMGIIVSGIGTGTFIMPPIANWTSQTTVGAHLILWWVRLWR